MNVMPINNTNISNNNPNSINDFSIFKSLLRLSIILFSSLLFWEVAIRFQAFSGDIIPNILAYNL